MSKAVANTTNNSALPAHLQGRTRTASIGNIDQSDLIIPRVKLLQAISPEVETFDEAKTGMFWHNVMNQSLGKEIRGYPIVMRKTYALWAPRGDDRGILARASDGFHWDTPDLEFTVKPKGSPKEVVYRLGKTVSEKVDPNSPPLSEFGSSIPEDPRSAPAAALTYEFLWLFPDFLELGPAIILNTRSSLRPAKALLSKIEARATATGVDHFLQAYKITSTDEKSQEGPYKGYSYIADGYVSEEHVDLMTKLHEKYQSMAWRASDEGDDAPEGGGGGGSREPPKPSGKTNF